MSGRHSRRRGDQGRVIIAHADDEQRAADLAAAYRHVLRDLLAADRSRVDTTPDRDGGYLVTVTYAPGPPELRVAR